MQVRDKDISLKITDIAREERGELPSCVCGRLACPCGVGRRAVNSGGSTPTVEPSLSACQRPAWSMPGLHITRRHHNCNSQPILPRPPPPTPMQPPTSTAPWRLTTTTAPRSSTSATRATGECTSGLRANPGSITAASPLGGSRREPGRLASSLAGAFFDVFKSHPVFRPSVRPNPTPGWTTRTPLWAGCTPRCAGGGSACVCVS